MDPETTKRDYLALYEGSADSVFRHVVLRVHDRELARDLTQESFLRLWEYVSQGKSIENYRAFLFRIANNLIIDHWRKKKEVSLDVLAEAGFEPEGDDHILMIQMLAGKQALAAVQKLDHSFQQVILLRYVEDLSVGDIADIIGETENTVSVRLHRALKKLREILEHGTT